MRVTADAPARHNRILHRRVYVGVAGGAVDGFKGPYMPVVPACLQSACREVQPSGANKESDQFRSPGVEMESG